VTRPSSASKAPRRGPYAKSSETRKRILTAALEVAEDVGFHNASVARIAECADVAVSNLHYHFGSREELLRELMRWLGRQLIADVREAGRTSGDYFAREEARFRAFLAYQHRNPAYTRLWEEIRLHHPALYAESNRRSLSGFRELRPMDDDEIAVQAHFLMGARYFVDQMIAGANGRPYPGDAAVVSAYMNLVRGGLALAPEE
jgi:AcrR family transcriptional regulator